MGQQIEDGIPCPHRVSKSLRNVKWPDAHPINQDIESFRRPTKRRTKGNNLVDIDPHTHEGPPPRGNQAAHRVRDEYNAPSPRPLAHDAVQIVGDLFHRPAKIIGKGDDGGVSINQVLTCGYDTLRG